MIEPIRKAMFPGVLVGIMCVVMMANLAAAPGAAVASTALSAGLAASADPQPVEEAAALETDRSPFDLLLNIFAPLIMNAEKIRPTPTPEPAAAPVIEQSQENNEDRPSSEGCAVGENFPQNVRRWCDLIMRTASNHGLDPNLIAAVMTIESAGNPDAYSHSGAVGLMQVMPRDGLAASFVCINGPCFANRPSMAELYDPDFNLDFAAGMLGGLYNRHGSWRDALRAYGPAGAGYSYADKVLGVYESNR